MATPWMPGVGPGPARLRCGRGEPSRGAELIREAITLHLDSLREAGEPIPRPVSRSEIVRVRAA